MKIIFSNHAKIRCRQRKISQLIVKQIIQKPEISYPGKSGERNVIAKIKKMKVRVVFFEEKNCVKIITVIRL